MESRCKAKSCLKALSLRQCAAGTRTGMLTMNMRVISSCSQSRLVVSRSTEVATNHERGPLLGVVGANVQAGYSRRAV